jgi:RHS repeat-associated protein
VVPSTGANNQSVAIHSGVSLAYDYDGLGRQVSRTAAGARSDFWFDATGMSLETAAATSRTYLRDPSGLPLSVTTELGTNRTYGRDRLGSTTAIVNNSGGLANTYTYDPYGQIVASSGTRPNSLKFTGGRQDPSSTWTTLGQRTYAPEFGRFTTLDPLAASVTDLNRYAYASCNPANFVDPTGTQACALLRAEIGVALVAAAAGALLGGPIGACGRRDRRRDSWATSSALQYRSGRRLWNGAGSARVGKRSPWARCSGVLRRCCIDVRPREPWLRDHSVRSRGVLAMGSAMQSPLG